MAEDERLLELTADIVAAHVANNTVALADVPALVRSVHEALSKLGGNPPEEETKARPAVSPRASVRPDHLVCLACGSKQKTLRRHIGVAHGLTPAEYRARFDLPASYPMVAPDYASRRREIAHAFGLGRKRQTPAAKRSGGDGAAPRAPASRRRRKN